MHMDRASHAFPASPPPQGWPTPHLGCLSTTTGTNKAEGVKTPPATRDRNPAMSRFARSTDQQPQNRPNAHEGHAETYPWRRRVTQLVFTVPAAAALAAGSGTSAYAADATEPPASSVAAPTDSAVPQTGDA